MGYGPENLKGAPIKFPSSGSSTGSRSPVSVARSASTPKPCRANQYRNPDTGRCKLIPKQRATPVERAVAGALGIKTPKATRGTSVSTKIAQSASRTATTAAVRGTVKAAKEFTKGAKQGYADYIASGGTAAAAAGRLGLVAAAGVAAYLGTSYVLKKIQQAKDKKAAQRAALADAYRQTRLDASAKLGRPLTAIEQAVLSDYFKREAAKIGWKV